MSARALSFSTVASFTTIVLAAAFMGCAVAPADHTDPAAAEASDEGQLSTLTTFGKSLVGTYMRIDGAGSLVRLTLDAAGSFKSDREVQCFRAPCPTIQDTGRFAASGTGTSGTLTLKSTTGSITSYAVVLQNTGAILDLTNSGKTQHMSRAPMICGGITAKACGSMVATVETVGGRPALYVQTLDGSTRRRLFFNNLGEDLSGTDDLPNGVNDASIGAILGMSFSANGARVAAVVGIAVDQSEVIVVDLDTGIGHVASHNTQYVMGTPDWSLDGTKVSYAMSVMGATYLEYFTTDLTAHAISQVTSGTGLPGVGEGIGMRSRLNAGADAILFSRSVGMGPPPVEDRISNVQRVPLTTGVIADVATDIAGSTVDVSRDEKKALVLRVLSIGNDGIVDRALFVRDLATGTERNLLAHGQIESAVFTNDGTTAIALIDTYTPADGTYAYSAKRIDLATGLTTSIAVPKTATRAELFIAK
jgi:hypothetical protein